MSAGISVEPDSSVFSMTESDELLLFPQSLEIILAPMNPVALITGASRGIGRGIVLELAKIGHDLVINYAGNVEAAKQTANDCVAVSKGLGKTIRAEICQADISLATDRQKLISFTREQFGRLDLLVNNAGVAPNVRADILEAGEESFDRLIAINVKGPYFLTQLAAKWMIEGIQNPKFKIQKPKIVTVSSISAYTASTNRGDYCVSKAALSMLTPLFAARLAEFGINVYEIRPGVIATDMTGAVKEKYDKLIADGLTPIQRWGTPEDIGRAVAAIASDAFPFSTGEVINVDGGFHLRRL
jgi:3-oxoacyl-[acyl-carrier protein] reductase